MSIQNTTRKTAVMHGNGVSVKFPFTFRINEEEDLKVYVKIGLGPFELKELETDYKLSDVVKDSNNNIISGNIEYPIIIAGEPNQPSPLTSADSIYGIRKTPRNQEESSAQVSFKSKDVERALDKATMQIQELTEDVSRAIKVEEWQSISPDEILDAIFDAEGNCAIYATNASNSATEASGYATNASGYATNASNSATAAANSAISANNAAASINRPLLSFIWSDHLINNQAWLRADTFSWQSGETYSSAYQHLLDDIGYVRYMIPNDDIQEKFYRSPSDDTTMFAWTNQYSTLYTESEFPENGDDFYYHNQVFGTVLSTGTEASSSAVTPTTETIGSYTITYYLADDGHKICLADQETTASNIYSESGIAWYYVLDTTNTRFKLPRTKWNFVGYRDTVGKYVPESLPNITGELNEVKMYGTASGAFKVSTTANSSTSSNQDIPTKKVEFDASESSSTYKENASVQQRATQMYLYFYVGNFSQSATEQTAGLNAELFNGKADISLQNISNTSGFRRLIEVSSPNILPSWYKVFAEYDPTTGEFVGNWCEQGGYLAASGTATFLKPFVDTNYNPFACTNRTDSGANGHNYCGSRTTTSMYVVLDGGGNWMACGYISQENL